MTTPSVKVIVPCYGYANWLNGCVSSALDQPGIDVRVLVVDDCSPDETPAVGKTLVAADSRVEYFRQPKNLGLIGTINTGLRWAEDSDYTVVLSADDLLVRGSLERAISVMERSPRVGLVYGRAAYGHVGRPAPSTAGRWVHTTVWSGQRWIRKLCRTAHNPISSPEVVVRTAVHIAAGGYDPDCVHTSDLNMWLRIAAISDVAFIHGVPQAIYRIHSDSMLRSNHDPIVDLSERRKAFDSLFSSCGGELADVAQLRALSGRALARQALWIASRAVDRGRSAGPDAVLIDRLIDFARDVYPDVERLREWHGYRLRRRLGAGRSGWFPPFLLTGAAHRACYHGRRLRGMALGA